MNHLSSFLFSLLCLGLSVPLQAQTSHSSPSPMMRYTDATAVEQTLLTYLQAGDEQDADALAKTMHDSYRVLLNDPNKGSVSTFDKATYLDLAKKGVIGGIAREVDILSLDIYQGLNAHVKTHLHSEKADFYNYYSLVKTDGKWWVVQDMLMMVPLE